MAKREAIWMDGEKSSGGNLRSRVQIKAEDGSIAADQGQTFVGFRFPRIRMPPNFRRQDLPLVNDRHRYWARR